MRGSLAKRRRGAVVLLLAFLVCFAAGCRKGPEPAGVRASEVKLQTSDGEGRGVVFAPPVGEPPAVLVLHGDYGLDDSVRAHARRLAEKGYLVLALDLYRGEKVDQLMDAHIVSRGLREERVRADLKAAVDWLVEQSSEVERGVAAVGWDIGGGYALDLAIADPRVTACVVCYGRLTTDPAILRKLNAPVLGVFGGKDEGITPQTRAEFVAAMKEAKKPVAGMHVYEECDGGFMTPPPGGKPSAADEKASQKAWVQIEKFLRERLR